MKKFLLIAALASLSMAQAQAQLTVHDFGSETWTASWGESYDAVGEFKHVSANGQYAVGCDDQMQSASQGGAFFWRRSNPDEIEFINKTSARITAWDVTNDGMIVGSFEDRDPELDEDEICYPAYKPLDGEWKTLPVPDDLSEFYAIYNTYFVQGATAVTPDGQYIAGSVFIKVGVNEKWGFDIANTYPMLWQLVDGEYQLVGDYRDLGEAGKSYTMVDGEWVKTDSVVNFDTFIVWDISDDGKTLVGVNTADCGGQNPAFIRDGVLYQFHNCAIDKTEEGFYANFNGGVCNSIDANGNMYGYYQDGEKNMKYFTYTADGEFAWTDSWTVCADKDGNKYTSSTAGVSYTLDCSDDGQVIAGAGVGYTELGSYTYPMLASNDNPSSILSQHNLSKVSINYQGGNLLYVNGIYSKATIYNMAGQQLQSIGQGSMFNMNGLAKGTYIVNVEGQNGKQAFKIVK